MKRIRVKEKCIELEEGRPDDLVEAIRDDDLPVGTYGRGAFDGHDQLLLRHLLLCVPRLRYPHGLKW